MAPPNNETHQAFREAVAWFSETVAHVPGSAWDGPGLGEWTVRELVSHTSRILTRTKDYAEATGGRIDTQSGAEYYANAMSTPGIDEQIAQRARESMSELGSDPASTVAATSRAVLDAIAPLGAEHPFVTPYGTLALGDYLPTRVLELVTHTLDLTRAIGAPGEPPPSALRTTMALLGELAAHGQAAGDVVLALTGRRALPAGFTVLQ